MNKEAVIKFFGSRVKVANAIGITRQALSFWGDEIPKSSHAPIRMAIELKALRDKLSAMPGGDQHLESVDRSVKKSLKTIGDK